MKNIAPKLIELFKKNYCAPQIAKIAKKIHEPATTIHYNIKKLEREKAIRTYKAVFDYKKINEGHCTYILVNLIREKYGEPEEVASQIAKDPRVESVDIITGDYEMIIKLRSKDIDEYYAFIKSAIKQYGFSKSISLTSLKQVKTEFVEL
ncbi:MAG: Transcriptional regulator, AsnC family [Parcubacteria group bacterium GW2011_GWA1_36_12]|nr:MAG: Transcriptional regulator, AsnC family [Parcubacteria group bacterium GW2011_GWA1_36_12]